MVLNATFNNITVISWRLVLLVEETGEPGENQFSDLSKNDHGTFTCHTGNGYGNNVTKNLHLSVNCKCLILKFVTMLSEFPKAQIIKLQTKI